VGSGALVASGALVGSTTTAVGSTTGASVVAGAAGAQAASTIVVISSVLIRVHIFFDILILLLYPFSVLSNISGTPGVIPNCCGLQVDLITKME
jgi:hypothetical protein